MRKNTLIIFPGNIDNVFFLNEIKFAKEHFDRVITFAYEDKKNNYEQVANYYELEYKVIKTKCLLSVFSLLTTFFSGKENELHAELNTVCKQNSSCKNKIKKIAYLLFYYMFAISSYREYLKLQLSNSDIYIYSFWMSRGAVAGAYIKNRINIKKFITRAHGYDLYEERNALCYLPFRKYIFDSVDNIYFISNQGCNYYKNKYDVCDDKLRLSYLGVKSNGQYKKRILSKTEICIVSCSSLIEVKRLDLIIDFLSQLTIRFKWYHIGNGKLMKKMSELAENKLPKESYEFIGNLDNDKIIPFYYNYDVDYFINMSDSEGLPVSIMEAFSVGIPSIARPVGGIREIVDEGTGFLIDLEDKREGMDVCNAEEFLRMRLNNIDCYRMYSEGAFTKWQEFFCRDTNYSYFYTNMKGEE